MELLSFDSFADFISAYLSVRRNRISMNTRIGEDLGIDGDDGIELMRDYSIKYSVDISSFDYSLYFGPEGCNPFIAIPYWLGLLPKLKTMTVGDLYNGAIEGKLVSPISNR